MVSEKPVEINPHVARDLASAQEFKRRTKTQTVPPSAETAAMLFCFAGLRLDHDAQSGRLESLTEKPSDQAIDLVARCGNLAMLEIAQKSIPNYDGAP
jgi:hypothetical protein